MVFSLLIESFSDLKRVKYQQEISGALPLIDSGELALSHTPR